jgi:uncharacterized membrane protein YccC
MTTATTAHPANFAGVPLGSWAFGIRIWVAVVVALAASFWLELEAPSTAAVCVAILAAPTRGQALDKACYRVLATVIGVVAALAITAFFSQTRDLLLAAYAGWLGLCVYVSGTLDGNRAYAAVLSGYTVALVAIQQTDTPQHVFETGIARGAAIAVGIVAIAVVNDVLAAPDNHLQLASRLTVLHRRVRDYAKAVLRDEAPDAACAAGLLRDMAALNPELGSLATESATGPIRSASARNAAVGLVAELHAARVLQALPVRADAARRDLIASALDRSIDAPSLISDATWLDHTSSSTTRPLSTPLVGALKELLRRDDEVRDGLTALDTGTRPRHAWRTPVYCSHRLAAEAGIRATVWFGLASAFFVFAGWPAAQASLSLVAVVIGLGAITPNSSAFTLMAFITALIATVLAGTLEFVILDGVTEFPLLAMALAPFVIGVTVLMTRPNPILLALGRLSLIFVLSILAPSNPETYNPEAFLFTSLFVCVATALLLAAQLVVPPISGERRQRWLLQSARDELDRVLSRRDRRLTPEEAMFRDAVRIGQLTAAGGASTRHRAALEAAVSCFDQAAAIRLCNAGLARLVGSPVSDLAVEAREALSTRDAQRLRNVARDLSDAASVDGTLITETSTVLALAGIVIEAAPAADPDLEHIA